MDFHCLTPLGDEHSREIDHGISEPHDIDFIPFDLKLWEDLGEIYHGTWMVKLDDVYFIHVSMLNIFLVIIVRTESSLWMKRYTGVRLTLLSVPMSSLVQNLCGGLKGCYGL